MMLGYELGAFYPSKGAPASRATALQVRSLAGETVSDLSCEVGHGEMVGVTGLAGMGHDEVPYLIAGHAPRSAGYVTVNGEPVKESVRHSLKAGIALVPANRIRDSVWGAGSAAENFSIASMRSMTRFGFLRRKHEIAVSIAKMQKYGVSPVSPTQLISRFSGGNQQKIVLARWLETKPQVLLLHEPTQGVDAGAKKEVYELIRRAAEGGTAIVIFSSDLEEIAHMCHRVLVLRRGSVSSELSEWELSEDRLMLATQGSISLNRIDEE
jgi:ribose transport system ATP-binding protein